VLGLEPPPDVVTGHLQSRYAINDADFKPVVRERNYGADEVAFLATLDDGAQPEVSYDAMTGRFEFPVAFVGQRYRLAIVIDGNPLVYELTASELRFMFPSAGRPEARRPMQTQVALSLPMAATMPVQLSSTGVWTQTDTMQVGPMVSFDWRLATPTFGSQVGMLDAAEHDRIYAFEYESHPSPAYYSIKAASSKSITQLVAQTETLDPPVPVLPNACARFAIPIASEAARIAAAAPRMYVGPPEGNWLLWAAPKPHELATAGILSFALATSGDDLDVEIPCHQPFPGVETLVASTSAMRFEIGVPNAQPTHLYNTTTRWVPIELASTCSAAPRVVAAATVGLPGGFDLDGVPLTTDGQVVPLDLSRDVTLTWSTVSPGPVDIAAVALHRLGVNNSITTVTTTMLVTTAESRVTIDRTQFEAGGRYVVSVFHQRQAPNAKLGDFATLALPIETSRILTSWFEVAAQ
jgi:hypothetical protein